MRTPLTAICGYLDLLEKEEKSDIAKRYLDIIRNRSQLLVSMTEELFRYSVLLSRESDAPAEQNAVKYSSGDLEITLESTGEIVFANTAPGLDEIQVGRLFDRFFTVESARKSTGLGLAIARSLVEQMGGSISAEYTDDRLHIWIFFRERGG